MKRILFFSIFIVFLFVPTLSTLSYYKGNKQVEIIENDVVRVKLHKVNQKKEKMRLELRRLRYKGMNLPINEDDYEIVEEKKALLKTLEVNSDEIKSKLKKRKKFSYHRFKSLKMAKVLLFNYSDIQFWGTVHLGQNQERFKVLFDTGSSWTWLPSENCDGCAQANIRTHYNCEQSNTCRNLNIKVGIEYGRGSIFGSVSQDNFHFEGEEMKNQTFVMVQYVSSDMPSLMFSGLVGLAPSEKMSGGFNSFLTNMKNNDLIKSKVFSVYLSRKNKETNSPALIFGGFEKEYMQGQDFKFCSVTSSEHWNVEFNGLMLNDKQGTDLLMPLNSNSALLDTGTSIITFPPNDFEKILNYFRTFDGECFLDNEEFEIVCPNIRRLKDLPDIKFRLCGNEFEMTPNEYAHWVIVRGGKYALIKFASLNIGANISILGDPFLQTFYTYYDFDNRRVGITKAKH